MYCRYAASMDFFELARIYEPASAYHAHLFAAAMGLGRRSAPGVFAHNALRAFRNRHDHGCGRSLAASHLDDAGDSAFGGHERRHSGAGSGGATSGVEAPSQRMELELAAPRSSGTVFIQL